MSDSVQPHKWQPTRLLCPWDSPGKNIGVGCHFLLQCITVKLKSLSHVQLLVTPWTAAYQAPPPMGFSRQEYWSFSFSIIPPKEHPGLMSFRMDWLDLLAVQETLKSLLQHHSSKASVLQRSAFFTVQLSHPYMTTGKTISLD